MKPPATRLAAVVACAVAFAVSSTARATGPGEPPAGDFVHTAAAEQKSNTPLPVVAEISGEQVARAIVRYKGPGMDDWSRIAMRRQGASWVALIPCGAVTLGTMRYWLQGFDATGMPTANSGDPKHPFEVPIRAEITSEAPRLPGRDPPRSCDADTSTDPGERGGEGPAPGLEAPVQAIGVPERYARWWIGVAGAIDFLTLPEGDDLCVLAPDGTPANKAAYYCSNPNGSDFPGRGASSQGTPLVAGAAGHVAGGLQAGDVRALVAVDYALTPAFLLGGRLGYVFNSYPSEGAAVVDRRAFGPKVHAEGRGTYVIGDAPLTRVGFAPTVFFSVGIAPFDGHAVSVVSASQPAPKVPISQPVNIWLTNGPWFVAVGGGLRYQFSPRSAFDAALRVNAAFGGAGALFTYGPEIAFQYGL
jgi:hypothetical protein